ncbi:MAG: hypothetical protein CMJ18_01860 [Phycisphaeraceae bacterium]|nr:hypothetical protein [Phycisphaeraceae bacterium]
MNKHMKWTVVFLLTLGWVGAAPAVAEEDDTILGGDGASEEVSVDMFDQQQPDPVVVKSSSGDSEDVEDQNISVDDGSISLHIQDQAIVKILQMLAIQSNRNILISPSVSGNVSAALYDVDFFEALDAILHTNGFGYQLEGNFVKVYTKEELKEIEDRNRRMETVVLRLKHLTAPDAAKFLEPLMSDGGAITISGDTAKGFDVTIGDGGSKSWALVDTLVIHDYAEVIDDMRKLINELDVRPKQILIEATILEARLNEANALGVDLNILVDYDLEIFDSPLTVVDQILTGDVVSGDTGGTGGPSEGFKAINGTGGAGQTTVGDTLTGRSGVKLGYVGDHVDVFVRALDEVTDTMVLATPKIMTLNRQAAKLIAGQKLGYISTTATETSTTQSIEFLEVGTSLLVRPFITDEDFIRLELRPKISDGGVTPIEGFVVPDETTNELIANVMVPNGKTIVLGGLFKEDTKVTRKQVPVIGDIPIAGWAGRGQDDVVERTEVIFMIRPTIMRDQSLTKLGAQTTDDIEFVRMGARNGLLPWSRTAMTTAHVRDAHRFLADGRKDMAMHSINKALTMAPQMTEAARLKEELTGERLYAPYKGLLQKSIDLHIFDQLGQ